MVDGLPPPTVDTQFTSTIPSEIGNLAGLKDLQLGKSLRGKCGIDQKVH